MSTDIRAEIAERRAEDTARTGAAQGIELPAERELPLVQFLNAPRVICEVKRCSPSIKNINLDLNPAEQAGHYYNSGIRNVSVLTEQNYFNGGLEDLIKIKTAFPDLSVLRKDFLLTEEDIDVSYRSGADAVLLIASLLTAEQLRGMYSLCCSYGMTPLVELHGLEDVEKARLIKPYLIGINSRDLRIFKIKPLQPLKIRAMIDWDCSIVYESGIKTEYDIDFVKGTNFEAALVGEAAVKNPGFAGRLAEAFSKPETQHKQNNFSFWKKLYSRCVPGRPLVKICGITNHDDLKLAAGLGADAAGFILAESPRKVSTDFIRSCMDFDILKIGVVVLAGGEALPDDIAELLKSGALDAVQFHGDERAEDYLKWPGYKAVRIKDESSAEAAGKYPGPAVLADAFSKTAHGGTGKRIDSDLVGKLSEQQTLWLAGGINPGNVKEIIETFSPELIDISSGVEASPGRKDPEKMKALFMEISEAVNG